MPMNILLEVKLNYFKTNKGVYRTFYYLDLNESSLYLFRIKAENNYGDSPWSIETPVQTIESIITPDGKRNVFNYEK